MTKLTISLFTFLLATSCIDYIRAQKPETPTWATTISYGHERKTSLQFYFHDVVSGVHLTDAMIAKPIQGNISSPVFGSLVMGDVPLTVSPDPMSKLVGRAQGLMGMASKEDFSLIMSMSYSFADGVYNGSSISILGRNSIMNVVRELPVVGGSGLFRMGRGYALAQTYSANATTFNAVVGYNITVFHH